MHVFELLLNCFSEPVFDNVHNAATMCIVESKEHSSLTVYDSRMIIGDLSLEQNLLQQRAVIEVWSIWHSTSTILTAMLQNSVVFLLLVDASITGIILWWIDVLLGLH